MEAKNNGIEGRAEVGFYVDEEGRISDVTLIKGFDRNCDEEAVRLVSGMSAWKPLMVDGVPIISYKQLSVVFWLNQAESDEY